MIFVNPGSGPVRDAKESCAIENMKQFAIDAGRPNATITRTPAEDDEGRFAFNMDGHEILMPGLPIEQVRFMGADTQNIWDFPRLYVDGSSWVWKFAIDNVDEAGQ